VTVTSGPGCAWTATLHDSWLAITAGASGTGNGTVQYTFSANSDRKNRTGTISIADQNFAVTQDGTH
jgi:hypothetical protein